MTMMPTTTPASPEHPHSRSWEDAWRKSFPAGAALTIIIPVFNERYLIEELLTQVLAVAAPGIGRLEIIVVDDGSTDGTTAIAQRFAAQHPDRVQFIAKGRNEGKGSAVRTGIDAATGDLIVIQDADLEYDPRDLAALVRPFLEDGADVVYGSRFAAGSRRRVLYFRHTIGNRILTVLSNLSTDLNLTDVETCYKMFRASLLKSIPIRSDDFAIEIEITAKIAKRGCQVFEVPISYRGRTYLEGKKIHWQDGIKALVAIGRFWLIDDLYRADKVGRRALSRLERTRRFNRWLAQAGISRRKVAIGNLVQCWLPAKRSPDLGNREPTVGETRWCWNAHVGPWLHKLAKTTEVIVPVGIPAARFLMGIPEGQGVEKHIGTLSERELPPVGENHHG